MLINSAVRALLARSLGGPLQSGSNKKEIIVIVSDKESPGVGRFVGSRTDGVVAQ